MMTYHRFACLLVKCEPLKKKSILWRPLLNVSLFQAVAVCQIIKLITALLTVVNPHRDCVYYINPTHC